MTQTLRPIEDISNLGWKTVPLWEKIDDEIADDDTSAISVVSPNVSKEFEVKLSAGVTPEVRSGHFIKFRATFTGTGTPLPSPNLNVLLYEGATLRGSVGIILVKDTWRNYQQEISESLASDIVDYSNLRFRANANISGFGTFTAKITQMSLEIPDAPPPRVQTTHQTITKRRDTKKTITIRTITKVTTVISKE